MSTFDKIKSIFYSGNTPFEGNTDEDDEIAAYSFTPNDNTKNFLSLLQSEKNKDVRAILNRKRS